MRITRLQLEHSRVRRRITAVAATATLLAGCGSTVATRQTAQLGGELGGVPTAQGAPAAEVPGELPVNASAAPAVGDRPSTGGAVARGPLPSAAPTASGGSVALAPTGPGWDREHVYVGLATVTDAPTVGHSLGINSLDYGDQNSYLKAVFDYVNEHGGVFGRKLVAVTYDVSSTTDANTTGQAACAKFTQDRRVVASLGGIANDGFYSCMKAAGVPVITDGYGMFFKAADLARYNGWLYLWHTLSVERLVPVMLERLQAQGYFTGWNTSTGSPANVPVKVGLLYGSEAYRPAAMAYLKGQLERRGIDVAAEFQAASPTDYSSAVVKFRQAGVTHVFLDPGAALFYPSQAESQRYWARYAVNSNNFIQSFLVNNAPPAQLRGLMGVGWIPSQDVDVRDSPGPNAGEATCFAIMRQAGASLAKNNYRYTAQTVCDMVLLFVKLARVGGGLDAQALLRSVRTVGTNFPWASQLGVGMASTDLSGAPVVRGLQYVESCRCVRYAGPGTTVP